MISYGLEYFACKSILSTKQDYFIPSFPIYKLLIYFSWLINLASTSSTTLKRSGKNRHPCLVPNLRGKSFSLSPLSMMLLLLSRFSCVRLCATPIDGSPPGSPVPGILQARTLEWVAISFSNAWKWKVKVKSLSRVRLPATPWTAAYQLPPSIGFSRQEYWSRVPLPSPKSMMLAVGYSYVAFIMLKKCPSILALLNVFIKKEYIGLCQKLFLHQLKWSCAFFLDSLMCIINTLINSCMLSHPYSLWIKPIW